MAKETKRRASMSRGNWYLLLLVVLALVAALITVGLRHSANPTTVKPSPSASFAPKASPGAAIMAAPATSPTPVIKPNPSPAKSQSGVITITSPTQGQTVSSGSRVTGVSTASGQQLHYQLKGGSSGQLALGQVTTDTTGNFSFNLSFMNDVSNGSDQGELEIYTLSSAGVETNVANVAVNIKG